MILKLSQKQKLVLTLLNDDQITDILFGGGAGGAKSFTVCLWAVLQCRQYAGIRIGLGRKELTKLKQTTVQTLLEEVHPALGVKPHEYHYNDLKGKIKYLNGSVIQMIELIDAPSDPDFDRFGSLNLTHTIIEESGEVSQKAKNVFHSRKNRYMNKVHNIVGKSITTCNPSQNFLKQEYYKPYKKLGAGEWQKWENGRVEVDGVMKPSYRAFIRSLATDNPFISRNYIEVLRQLPPAEKKRLLEGNWDYTDDDLVLFKSMLLDKATIRAISSGSKAIGVDISDSGGDETILSLVEASVIVDQKNVEIDKSEGATPIGEQIALAVIKYAQQNGFEPKDAFRIAIDGVGVGASTRDFLFSKGWRVRIFIAGSAPQTPPNEPIMFRNLRGQTIYRMSQEMERGTFSIYARLATYEALKDELMAHEYSTEERVILIKQKKDIKQALGRSPDHAESAYIAFWASKDDNDSKYNANRISF